MIRLPALLVFLAFAFACAPTLKEYQTKPATTTLVTDDQKELNATFYPEPYPGVPGVILLPDTRSDMRHYVGFASKLNRAGFAVLAMDFRYKDLISKARSRDEAISLIKKQDLNALVDHDVKAAVDFISRQNGVAPGRICLIGSSLGSRVALVSGVKYKIRGLVLVSLSGQEAFLGGKPIKSLLEDYGDRPVLFMTSEKDWGGNYKAEEHNRLYFEWARGPKELKIWPGSGHGVDIIGRKEALEFVARWLRDNL